MVILQATAGDLLWIKEFISKYEHLDLFDLQYLFLSLESKIYFDSKRSIIVVVLAYKGTRDAEVHVYCQKESRGKYCIQFLKKLLDNYNVYERLLLYTKTPEAARLAKLFGATKEAHGLYVITNGGT